MLWLLVRFIAYEQLTRMLARQTPNADYAFPFPLFCTYLSPEHIICLTNEFGQSSMYTLFTAIVSTSTEKKFMMAFNEYGMW